MSRWSTVSNGQTFVVEATPSGVVRFEITPPGPFTADPDLADEIVSKIALATGVARQSKPQE